MRKVSYLILISFILTIIPITPSVEAQGYTPLTTQEWSTFINKCVEFLDWVNTHGYVNLGPTYRPGAAGGSYTPTNPTVNAGPVCGIANEHHYASPDFSTSSSRVTPSTNQLKVVDFCSATTPWFTNCVADTGVLTGSRVRDPYCYQQVFNSCTSGSNFDRNIVFAAEYSSSWVPVTATSSNGCGFTKFSVLPIVPQYETVSAASGCSSTTVLALWTSTNLQKLLPNHFEDEFPDYNLPLTTEFDRQCSGFGTSTLTSATAGFKLDISMPSGFIYLITAVGDNVGFDATEDSSLVVTGSDDFDNPVGVLFGQFVITSTNPDEYYKWTLWRLGFWDRSVNETSTVTLSYTVTVDNSLTNRACVLAPMLSTTNTNSDFNFVSLYAQGSSGGVNAGLISSFTRPSWINTPTFHIVNSEDDSELEGVTLTFSDNELDYTCMTDINGECTMTNILSQTGTLLAEFPPYADNTYTIIFPSSCYDNTCIIEIEFDVNAVDETITPTTPGIIINCEGSQKFKAQNEPIFQTCSRNSLSNVYIFLYWLKTNPPDSPVNLLWVGSDGRLSLDFRYPVNGNLSNGQVGDYVIYVTNDTGAYLYSRSLCVYSSTQNDCTLRSIDGGLLAALDEISNQKIVIKKQVTSTTAAATIQDSEEKVAGYLQTLVQYIVVVAGFVIAVIMYWVSSHRRKDV